MIPVVTLINGTGYPDKYVTFMRNMVPGIRFLTDRFLSDGAQLNYNWPGWWAKMELFSPQKQHLRPCLYIDLDTLVIGNIDHMRTPVDSLWMLRDAYRRYGGQSSIMLIPKDVGDIWTNWIARPDHWMKLFNGDQNYLERYPYKVLQLTYPGLYSYKVHCRNGCPNDARIVFFHGQPKPHNVRGWAGDFWKQLTAT